MDPTPAIPRGKCQERADALPYASEQRPDETSIAVRGPCCLGIGPRRQAATGREGEGVLGVAMFGTNPWLPDFQRQRRFLSRNGFIESE